MKKIILLCLLLAAKLIQAQQEAPINSVEIYTVAEGLKDAEKYQEALDEMNKIDRNDTNYLPALLEKTVILIDLKKYKEALETSKEGLEIHSRFIEEFYLDLGLCYDNLERREEALATYDEALKLFPKSASLYYNKAITYEHQDKYQEALALFKKILQMNPYHALSHLQLGLLAADQGMVSQAVMSLNMFLVLEPNDSRSFAVLKKLNEIVSSKYERKEKKLKLSPEGGDDFSDLDLIISNYAALNKKFKTPAKLELAIVKQNYALFTKMTYDKNDKGFWMQTYVPFFKAVIDQNKFREFTWNMIQPSQNEEHIKLVKKHTLEIAGFKKWADETIEKSAPDVSVTVNNKTLALRPVFDNHKLYCLVTFNGKDKLKGYCECYHPNGALQSTGNFNDNGKKTGTWNTYFKNGGLNQTVNYLNDSLEGALISYYPDGTVKHKRNFKNSKIDGPEEFYNEAGLMSKFQETRADMIDGKMIMYYDLGEKFRHYTATYSKGNIVDTVYEYYADGGLRTKQTFLKNNPEGPTIAYYRNGKLSSLVNMSKGLKDGEYKSWHENGKLSLEGHYKADLAQGPWKKYEYDGTLSEEYECDDKGRMTGLDKNYDTDGKLHLTLELNKGEVVGYTFYAKDGSVLKTDHKRKGTFDFVGYYPGGQKKSEGTYIMDKKTGTWKYYDLFGNLSDIEVFNDKGELDGKCTTYYPNGTLKEESAYKNGKRDGYACSYFGNGKKENEGWYIHGLAQGYWNNYHKNGSLSAKKYLLNDELSGYQQYFSTSGKVVREEFFKDKLLSKINYYDTAGVIFETVLLKNGTGHFQAHQFNKQLSLEATNIYGIEHGESKAYNYNGKLIREGSYFNGQQNGHWVNYDNNGKISEESDYSYGKLTGKRNFYQKGKLYITESFEDGKTEGEKIWYYDNGQIETKKNIHNGKAEGEAFYYDPTGELQLIRYYHEGIQVAYSYNDKNGNPVPKIPTVSGTYKVTAYFKNGKVSREYEVVKGQDQGKSVRYYSNGKIQESYSNKDDELDGPSIEYYMDGKIKTEENYEYGNLQGVYKEYFPDGKLEKELNYVSGTLEGDARYYNTSGKLIRMERFFDDQVTKQTNF